MNARVLHPNLHERSKRFPGAGIVAACAATGGCTGAQQPPQAAPESLREDAVSRELPREKIEAALDDAARRASLPREQIAVSVAQTVTWSDGSLGCPQPGMMYTQALVPGFRIVLNAGGQQLAYHASTAGHPTFCPPERVVRPAAVDGVR
jgi:hypothetical protein